MIYRDLYVPERREKKREIEKKIKLISFFFCSQRFGQKNFCSNILVWDIPVFFSVPDWTWVVFYLLKGILFRM